VTSGDVRKVINELAKDDTSESEEGEDFDIYGVEGD